jgi:hypothetical protein
MGFAASTLWGILTLLSADIQMFSGSTLVSPCRSFFLRATRSYRYFNFLKNPWPVFISKPIIGTIFI